MSKGPLTQQTVKVQPNGSGRSEGTVSVIRRSATSAASRSLSLVVTETNAYEGSGGNLGGVGMHQAKVSALYPSSATANAYTR